MIFLSNKKRDLTQILNILSECVSPSSVFVMIDFDKIVDIMNYDKYMILKSCTGSIYSDYGNYHSSIETTIPVIGHNYKYVCNNVLTAQELNETKAMRLLYSKNQILKYCWKSEVIMHVLVYNLDDITEDIISYFSNILPEETAIGIDNLNREELMKIIHKDLNEILSNLNMTIEKPSVKVTENVSTSNVESTDNEETVNDVDFTESPISNTERATNTFLENYRFSLIDFGDINVSAA